MHRGFTLLLGVLQLGQGPGPFRTEFDGAAKAQGMIPDAANRLRAGDTRIWDVINLG